jgi:thiosulfate/3-mercaptopyruvate sulfurtransferase
MDFTTTIDVASLQALVGKPSIAILDCRFDLSAPAAGRQAYERRHIPTAHFVDLNQDLSSPPTASSGRHPLPPP